VSVFVFLAKSAVVRAVVGVRILQQKEKISNARARTKAEEVNTEGKEKEMENKRALPPRAGERTMCQASRTTHSASKENNGYQKKKDRDGNHRQPSSRIDRRLK
jgi:hypothetical protein